MSREREEGDKKDYDLCRFARAEQSRRPHVETFETLGVEIGNETYAFPEIARAFLTPPPTAIG